MTQDFLTSPVSLENKTVYVAGHRGLVGSALLRRLERENCTVLTNELDLRDQRGVYHWMVDTAPDFVILAAAKVGGIGANAAYPAEFLYDNLMIAAHVLHAAHAAQVQKLLYLGSSCIYPKHAAQPITEDALLTGALEETNEAYAIAKIAGLKLAQSYRRQHGCDFISVMPCNLYGENDRFDAENSHVIPALMMKAHAAKISGAGVLNVWGSGTPRREFLFADDAADGMVFLLKNYAGEAPVNLGTGTDITIAELAQDIAAVVGFGGDIVCDETKPDGAPQKCLDCRRINAAGWTAQTSLRDGLEKTYAWYVEHAA